MKKLITMLAMMLVLATTAFAKPVAEYIEDIGYVETRTEYQGKVTTDIVQSVENDLHSITETMDGFICEFCYVDFTQVTGEADKEFFEWLKGYSKAWFTYENDVYMWYNCQKGDVVFVHYYIIDGE